MRIRTLNNEDLGGLSELYFQFWGEKSNVEKMQEQLEIIDAENNHIILVCEIDDKIVGSVMGVVCRELYGDCKPFLVIENMIVDKEYRNKGVGRRLINELESQAEERNCSQLILVTEKERIDACAFYEKNGFSTHTTGYKKKINSK